MPLPNGRSDIVLATVIQRTEGALQSVAKSGPTVSERAHGRRCEDASNGAPILDADRPAVRCDVASSQRVSIRYRLSIKRPSDSAGVRSLLKNSLRVLLFVPKSRILQDRGFEDGSGETQPIIPSRRMHSTRTTVPAARSRRGSGRTMTQQDFQIFAADVMRRIQLPHLLERVRHLPAAG